jgi:hypothetical protein
MDDTPSPVRPRRRLARAAGLLAVGIVAGSILAGTMTAGAQSSTGNTSGSTSSVATASSGSSSESNETALTGTTAQKVRTAALAAVPGGTIIRVETSRDGWSYEAHVRKADGTQVVVLMDKNFKVTSVDAHHCDEGSSSP